MTTLVNLTDRRIFMWKVTHKDKWGTYHDKKCIEPSGTILDGTTFKSIANTEINGYPVQMHYRRYDIELPPRQDDTIYIVDFETLKVITYLYPDRTDFVAPDTKTAGRDEDRCICHYFEFIQFNQKTHMTKAEVEANRNFDL